MAYEKHWGKESEFIFIDGMGTWQKSYIIDRSDQEWLKLYIAAHEASPHAHHQAGVEYARYKLREIYEGKSHIGYKRYIKNKREANQCQK